MALKQVSILDLKKEVIKILKPLFGDGIQASIDGMYDSGNPKELLEVFHELLTGYMDEKIAERKMDDMIKKFPNLKSEMLKYGKK